jgi:hypothetical protein
MNKDKDTFKILMETNGWKQITDFPLGNREDAYYLNGFIAYHRNYYMVVAGQVPLELATKLYEDNPKSLEIRVDGHGGNLHPKEYGGDSAFGKSKVILDAIFADLRHKWWDTKEITTADLDEKYNIAQAELIKKNPDEFGVDLYHIDTWEGFAVFSEFIVNHTIKSTWFD